MTQRSSPQLALQPFTPDDVIAGRLPVPKGARPDEVAYRAAARALDTERLCLVLVKDPAGSHVGYLAAPSSSFASLDGSAYSPLVAAFAGAPGHRGPGVYASPTPLGWSAIASLEDRSIRIVAGDRDTVASLAEIQGIPLFDLAGDESPGEDAGDDVAWVPSHRSIEEREEKRERTALVAGGMIAAAAAIAWLGFSFAAGIAGASTGIAAIGAAVAAPAVDPEQLVRSQRPQQAQTTLRHLLEVSDLARQTKGKVSLYRVDRGSAQFVLELPAWVQRQQIEALGGTAKVSATAKGVLVDGRLVLESRS